MKTQLRVFRTVAKPEGSPTFRSGFVRLSFPAYVEDEAPVAVRAGGDEYRLIDGRLFRPLPVEHYARTLADREQDLVNRMLAPHVTPDQHSALLGRTSAELGGSGMDLTETDRGAVLRESAKNYALIDGKFFVPTPGPLIHVAVRRVRPSWEATADEPFATTAQIVPGETTRSEFGAYFTIGQLDEALEFAHGLMSQSKDYIPSASSLRESLEVDAEIDFPDLRPMQIWFRSHADLFTATYKQIHDFGRDGVAATLALRMDLQRRCGGKDPFLETIWAQGWKREFAAHLAEYDVAGLELTLGPLQDRLLDLAQRQGDRHAVYGTLMNRSYLEWAVPGYHARQPHAIDDDDLSALTDDYADGISEFKP